MTRLQLAIDTLDLEEARSLVEAVADPIDLVEAGTPLIKRFGMRAIEVLASAAPGKSVVADMKTMDGGAFEATLAFESGADIVTVLGCASDATVEAVVGVSQRFGGRVAADLLGVTDVPKRTLELVKLGVDLIGVHAGTDARNKVNLDSLGDLVAVQEITDIDVMVAGGLSVATLPSVLARKPAIVVVGSAITGSQDPSRAAAEIRRLIDGC